MTASAPFGMVGVFGTPSTIIEAAAQLRALGFNAIDAYTPYPVEGLDRLTRPGRAAALPLMIFAGGVIGAIWGYFIQYWDEALNYPLNVGGRPHDSWPAFTVGAFEITVLFAVAAGFFGLLALCQLPRLYHPIFAAAEFERASCDRFVLCVETRDPNFEPETIRRIFEQHGAEAVAEVTE